MLRRWRGSTPSLLLLFPPLRQLRTIITAPPPTWVSNLREDAKQSARSISYDIKIFDEVSWRRKCFTFDKDAWDPARMSSLVRRRLCLGDENTEYTVIGEAFSFPDREDSPVVNEPAAACKLLWDHNSPTEKILIQLSDHFPPLLWHTVKPTLDSLKRVFSEFLDTDTQHMKAHLPYYENVQNAIESQMGETLCDTLSPSHIKNRFIDDMRKRDPRTIELDHPNEHHLYLGSTPHFRIIEDRMMKSNPFVFGWPLLLSDGNVHLEETPLRMAVFRTIFSKSLILLHSRLDLQVDHRLANLSGDDHEDTLLEVPVFATLNYPSNTRLCGGRPLVKRFNDVMGTTLPLDTPVDLLAVVAKEEIVKGNQELLEELRFLTAASERGPDVERVFRLSEDQLSSNRIVGQLAYTIVYLALVCYQKYVEDVFNVYKGHASDLVRVACAKGATIVGRQDLVEELIAAEKEGRCKQMMTATMSRASQATTLPGNPK